MKAQSRVFHDQVDLLIKWFEEWTECEQSVVLYFMIRKLSQRQNKFLSQVISQNDQDSSQIQLAELQSNDPAYIQSLNQESKEFAVKQLLSLLPLLKINNKAAKTEYLNIVPKIFSHSIRTMRNLEESRHLLSYCLIHPAITSSERLELNQYRLTLSKLEKQQVDDSNSADPGKENLGNLKSSQGIIPLDLVDLNTWPNNGSASTRDSGIGLEQLATFASGVTQVPAAGRAITSTAACHDNACGLGQSLQQLQAYQMATVEALLQQNPKTHRKLTRTGPFTPPGTAVCDWLNKHHDEMSDPHAPLSPQSSLSSGSGDSQHDDGYMKNTFLEERSGMRDVPIWLKSLRLHKYSNLFQQMSYEEMLGLTEEWLQSQNVTKGARHKIVLSIQKLKARQNQLRTLENEIMDSGNLKQGLQEIKGMLNTPIKAFSTNSPTVCSNDALIAEGDIPGQMTRVMGKICTQLLVSTRPSDCSCFAFYLQLLDKCKMHEAFSAEQKKKLGSWKQQIQKVWQLSDHRKKGNLFQGPRTLRGQLPKPGVVGQPTWALSPQQPPIMASTLAPTANNLFRNNSLNTHFTSRQPLNELQFKQQIARTQSVPMTKINHSAPGPDYGMMEPELAARLDSLCLSMTEHALGNLDSSDKGCTL